MGDEQTEGAARWWNTDRGRIALLILCVCGLFALPWLASAVSQRDARVLLVGVAITAAALLLSLLLFFLPSGGGSGSVIELWILPALIISWLAAVLVPMFITARDTAHFANWREGLVADGGRAFPLGGKGAPYWRGSHVGSPQHNPVVANHKPLWRLDQVWPPRPESAASYHPLVWGGATRAWVAAEDGLDGRPAAVLSEEGIALKIQAADGQAPAERLCALVFIAPDGGTYTIRGAVRLSAEGSKGTVRLTLLRRTRTGAAELASLALRNGGQVEIRGFAAKVAAGDELVLAPRIDGPGVTADVLLRDLVVRRQDDNAPEQAKSASESP